MQNKQKRYEFVWVDSNAASSLVVHCYSDEEAMERAKIHGYTEPKWYKPSTWNNHWTCGNVWNL